MFPLFNRISVPWTAVIYPGKTSWKYAQLSFILKKPTGESTELLLPVYDNCTSSCGYFDCPLGTSCLHIARKTICHRGPPMILGLPNGNLNKQTRFTRYHLSMAINKLFSTTFCIPVFQWHLQPADDRSKYHKLRTLIKAQLMQLRSGMLLPSPITGYFL